jgi:hypothetical protein
LTATTSVSTSVAEPHHVNAVSVKHQIYTFCGIISFKAEVVGAEAASPYGSGFAKMMQILVALALQHWFLQYIYKVC